MATKKTKLKITKHNGEEIHTEAENYSAKDTNEAIHNAQSNETAQYTVLIGDEIIDARSIESVNKIKAD